MKRPARPLPPDKLLAIPAGTGVPRFQAGPESAKGKPPKTVGTRGFAAHRRTTSGWRWPIVPTCALLIASLAAGPSAAVEGLDFTCPTTPTADPTHGRIVLDGDACVILDSIIVTVASGYTLQQAAAALNRRAGWTVRPIQPWHSRFITATYTPDKLTLAELKAEQTAIQAEPWAEHVEIDALAFAAIGGSGGDPAPQPEASIVPFEGHAGERYRYNRTFCWALDDTALAAERAMREAMGETGHPPVTFELTSSADFDLCLFETGDIDPRADWFPQGYCDFYVQYDPEGNWSDSPVAGSATLRDGNETIVWAGALAGHTLCVDPSTSVFGRENTWELAMFEEPTAAESSGGGE